jgi:hypothetical protein
MPWQQHQQTLNSPWQLLTGTGTGTGVSTGAGLATASTLLPQSCTAQITARLDTPQPPAHAPGGGGLGRGRGGVNGRSTVRLFGDMFKSLLQALASDVCVKLSRIHGKPLQGVTQLHVASSAAASRSL